MERRALLAGAAALLAAPLAAEGQQPTKVLRIGVLGGALDSSLDNAFRDELRQFGSYAATLSDLHHRSATFVDRILKGVKPSDLPVEQPTKFELVINLKTPRPSASRSRRRSWRGRIR